MSSLEPSHEDERTAESVERTVTVTGRDLSLSVPGDASQSEAAAIAAAVSAHVTDQQRAAVAAAAARETVEYVDEWKLAGRLERIGKRRRPKNVERGDEWKAAARARY